MTGRIGAEPRRPLDDRPAGARGAVHRQVVGPRWVVVCLAFARYLLVIHLAIVPRDARRLLHLGPKCRVASQTLLQSRERALMLLFRAVLPAPNCCREHGGVAWRLVVTEPSRWPIRR
jgi:hypothetical protein